MKSGGDCFICERVIKEVEKKIENDKSKVRIMPCVDCLLFIIYATATNFEEIFCIPFRIRRITSKKFSNKRAPIYQVLV